MPGAASRQPFEKRRPTRKPTTADRNQNASVCLDITKSYTRTDLASERVQHGVPPLWPWAAGEVCFYFGDEG